jgi:2-polyprenyl-3-methyl-5-hydroxy-6-metoxy-1,4-benzoquinol methylase
MIHRQFINADTVWTLKLIGTTSTARRRRTLSVGIVRTSLELIEHAAAHGHSASIIDVGVGESTLVDDLVVRGYRNITILDISQTAIDVTKKRLGSASEDIHWLIGDITSTELEPCSYDVWHDRAVFHLLTAGDARMTYVRQVAKAVKAGGT